MIHINIQLLRRFIRRSVLFKNTVVRGDEQLKY